MRALMSRGRAVWSSIMTDGLVTAIGRQVITTAQGQRFTWSHGAPLLKEQHLPVIWSQPTVSALLRNLVTRICSSRRSFAF